jgi:hypothetical protein
MRPVVMLLAVRLPAMAGTERASGMLYLRKPFGLDELGTTVLYAVSAAPPASGPSR